jgi:hypothetical protein
LVPTFKDTIQINLKKGNNIQIRCKAEFGKINYLLAVAKLFLPEVNLPEKSTPLPNYMPFYLF